MATAATIPSSVVQQLIVDSISSGAASLDELLNSTTPQHHKVETPSTIVPTTVSDQFANPNNTTNTSPQKNTISFNSPTCVDILLRSPCWHPR